MDRDFTFVVDIVASAQRVRGYLEGVSRVDFMQNVQLQDSVIRRLEIIGKAAGRVSASFRERHATVPCSRMIGACNRMIHTYEAVDLGIGWTTAHDRIPELLALVEPLLPAKPDETSENV